MNLHKMFTLCLLLFVATPVFSSSTQEECEANGGTWIENDLGNKCQKKTNMLPKESDIQNESRKYKANALSDHKINKDESTKSRWHIIAPNNPENKTSSQILERECVRNGGSWVTATSACLVHGKNINAIDHNSTRSNKRVPQGKSMGACPPPGMTDCQFKNGFCWCRLDPDKDSKKLEAELEN